jgi:hypothetical protein
MQASCFSETSAALTTRRYIPEDRILKTEL